MFNEKINAIEEKIKHSQAIDQAGKDELLELLDELNTELTKLENSRANTGRGQDIVGKTGRFAEQVIAGDGETSKVNQAGSELRNSVAEFEVSHPKLVQIINRICIMLSDIGI